MDNAPDVATKEARRNREMDSLPIPGRNPANLTNFLESEIGKAYWKKNKAHFEAKGLHTPEDLISLQEERYHDLETEDNPDQFAARVLNQIHTQPARGGEGASLDTLAPVPFIQTPEGPVMMESIFELARNNNVDLETRISAIETYVRNQEAKKDAARPGETFDQYMARMDRITSGQEAMWSPELKYAKEVLLSLKSLRRPGEREDSLPPVRTVEGTHSHNPPEEAAAPTQTSSPPQTVQKPLNSGAPTNASSTSSGATTKSPPAQQQPQNPATVTTPTPTPQPQPKPQKQQSQTPNSATPAAQATAAQAAQESFEQAAASQLPILAEGKDTTAQKTTEIQLLPEKNNEEVSFTDTLSQEDQVIWQGILRINDLYKDGEVSEALERLQGDFTPENADFVLERVEKSAEKRQNHGDTFGARQQRMLGTNLEQLTGHVFGRDVKRSA